MNTVYITESNFKSIARECPSQYQDAQFIEELYKKEICSLLCKKERDVIASVKVAMEAFQDYDELIRILKFKEKPNLVRKLDKKTRLVYLGGSPAYHKHETCDWLKASYKNYEIPVEISDACVEAYRSFFLANIELYENNRSAFFAKVEIKFNVIIRNVREHSAQNSGAEQFLNFDSEPEHELLSKIHALSSEMIQYRFSRDLVRGAISKYGSICHFVTKDRYKYPITDDEFKVISLWLKYKTELKKLITKHLIIKLNPELKFDKRCLDYFGFKSCSDCFKPENAG
ncbi:hypothetical protein BCU98_02885 [Vibrio splendidus]|uniref:hypothetical protein n=1 Tax=Vibrio splendidus TaxID=29497 RepID=UPI000C83D921|nr:hypothetical protein [Vibrio splendidus]PMG11782.1 hypothetical protein BCU98_02885 [Vibrio splendidus]